MLLFDVTCISVIKNGNLELFNCIKKNRISVVNKTEAFKKNNRFIGLLNCFAMFGSGSYRMWMCNSNAAKTLRKIYSSTYQMLSHFATKWHRRVIVTFFYYLSLIFSYIFSEWPFFSVKFYPVGKSETFPLCFRVCIAQQITL